MKINEAPEKIFINSNLENRTWLIGKGDSSFIEYTRTDAFIEKAIKFFASHIQDNSGGYDRAYVIENFRKYMEGE